MKEVLSKELQTEWNKDLIKFFNAQNWGLVSKVFAQLELMWDSKIPTACTNGLFLKINPNFFFHFSQPERLFILVHELFHVILKHPVVTNCPDINQLKRWQYACDYAINAMLVAESERSGSCISMPKVEGKNFGLYNPKYRGWSDLEIYNDLPEDFSENDLPDFEIGDGKNNLNDQQLESAINDIILKAEAMVKQSGQGASLDALPGAVRKILDDIHEPKVPWQNELLEFANTLVPTDYTFRKPNKRYMCIEPMGYLPSLGEERIQSMVWVPDCSGSFTDEQVSLMASELTNVRDIIKPTELTILPFTHELGKPTVLQENEPATADMLMQAGGTNIEPVIDWGIENNPELMIIITDGKFDTYEPNINFPILWLIVNNPEWTSNLGRVIHVSLRD